MELVDVTATAAVAGAGWLASETGGVAGEDGVGAAAADGGVCAATGASIGSP